jgi:hypothetical protein
MTTNRKGCAGLHRATRKPSNGNCNSTGLAARVNAAIVTLSLWGLLPIAVADWIIYQEGPHDD